MELNPFRAPAIRLEIEISRVDGGIRKQSDQLEAWQAFDPVVQQNAWERAQAEIAKIDTTLKNLDQEESTLPQKRSNSVTIGLAVGAVAVVVATGGVAFWGGLAIEGVVASLGGAAALSGGALFTSGSKVRHQYQALADRRAKAQADRSAIKSRADGIQTEIARHKRVDPVLLAGRRDALLRERAGLMQQLEPLAARRAKVDERIAPFVAQISELKRLLERLHERLATADRLVRDLDAAPTPRDRALLHEQCRKLFGQDKPGHVRRSLQKEVDAHARTLKKLQHQASEKAALAILGTNRVVLDGSNLCYRFEKEFIGLIALRSAVTALLDSHFSVVVIFDRSILIKLKMAREDIRAAIDLRAPIHFMASKRSADETLLREAEPEHSAVISRDRFRDFRDMPVVKDRRVFDQNIMESRIEIPALDINAPFAP